MDAQVMVIDDEEGLARLMNEIINMEGYSCCWSSDSAKAVSEILKHPPQLVITDICMPELSGVELFQEVSKYLKCDFAFHTAHCKFSDQQLMEMGAVQVFKKPLKMEVLINFLNHYFSKPHSHYG